MQSYSTSSDYPNGFQYGSSMYVYSGEDGSLAPIYSVLDNTVQLSNPVVLAANGDFSFAALDGGYNLKIVGNGFTESINGILFSTVTTPSSSNSIVSLEPLQAVPATDPSAGQLYTSSNGDLHYITPSGIDSVASLPVAAAGFLNNDGAGVLSYKTIISSDTPTDPGVPTAGTTQVSSASDHVHQSYRPSQRMTAYTTDWLSNTTDFITGNAYATGTLTSPTVTDVNHIGQIVYRCHATNANSGYGHLTNGSQIIVNGGESFTWVVRFDVVAGQRCLFGISNSYTPPTDPADFLGFDIAATTLRGLAIKSGSGTTATGTTLTVSAATWYSLNMTVSSDKSLVTYTVKNDAGTTLWSSTTAANVPTAAGYILQAGTIGTPGGAVNIVTVDYTEVLFNKGVQRGFTVPTPNVGNPVYGFGSVTTGGLGKTAYHVTTTADSGVGSFRDACSVGDRYITFDVGGTFALGDYIRVKSNTTIDGSTAPSTGVTFTGYPILCYNGVHDIVITNVRHRSGWRPVGGVRNSNGTCMEVYNGSYNVVIDKCSFSDFDDEAISVGKLSYNVTVQNCIFGAGAWVGHKFTMLVGDRSTRVSILRNIFAGTPEQRNPAIQYDDTTQLVAPSIVADVVNNLVWKPSVYGTGVYYGAKANVTGNYYYSTSGIVGAFNRQIEIFNDTNAVGHAYLSNNYSKDGGTFATTGTTPAAEANPYAVDAYALITATSAAIAATSCYANAGCRVGGLDATDTAILNDINGNIP